MLRITRMDGKAGPVTLKLEGKVSDQWARLLETECRSLLRDGQDVRLDFSDVSFMDAEGVGVVRDFPRQQVCIVNAPRFIEELLKWGGAQ